MQRDRSDGHDRTIGILGGGAWGFALAGVAAAGGPVRLWARDPNAVAAANAAHATPYLPGVILPAALAATVDLADLADCTALLAVMPAAALGDVLARLTIFAPRPLVLCAKGLGPGGARLSAVAAAALPGWPLAVLSGPTFASEVARGLPAAATIAAADFALAEALAARLSRPAFRLYATTDVAGVEIGGAVKNVLAIAAGVVTGAALGDNARAATVTRGFAELRRYGLACGADPATLGGLSGLGDLILTCGPGSRNFAFGVALGEGASPAARNGTVEGAATAPILAADALARGIDMPIAAAVADLVAGTVSVADVVARLLSRPRARE